MRVDAPVSRRWGSSCGAPIERRAGGRAEDHVSDPASGPALPESEPEPATLERCRCRGPRHRRSPALGSGLRPWGGMTLRTAVADCHACALHQTRTQTVFGVGDPDCQSDDYRRGTGRRRGSPGRALRRSRRPVADRDARGDRLRAASRSISPTSSSAGRRATATPTSRRRPPASLICIARSS